jgi:hypothetical protein
MGSPFLAIWLSGIDAWLGAARYPRFTDIHHQQARLAWAISEHAFGMLSGMWLLPLPVKKRRTADRMAALSLRVIQGGKR